MKKWIGNATFWTRAFLDKRKEKRKLIGENPEKNFLNLVIKNLSKTKSLLDIGTGLGKTPILLAKHAKEVWGIDPARKLINYAKLRTKNLRIKNVYFEVADGRNLPFEKEKFDIVTSQRGPATDNIGFAREAFRVLKKGGRLIEITIGEKDKENIKRTFGRGQNYCGLINNVSEAENKKQLLKKVGFRKIRTKYYNPTEYFATKRDLVLRLSRTPIIPNFNLKKDYKLINKIINKYSTTKGIKTNAHRLIIIAEK
ncbi:MAG: class I SAM-dependent methyltransferase [DPANN group archaeon]|nr:class I SAM-dependent methyltransferase [DPANN group archaeon]